MKKPGKKRLARARKALVVAMIGTVITSIAISRVHEDIDPPSKPK